MLNELKNVTKEEKKDIKID